MTQSNFRIGRTSANGKVFELFNGNNPRARYFDIELVNENLAELWELTQNDVKTHQTNLQFPTKKWHLKLAKRNKHLLASNQSIFRMRHFWLNAKTSDNESKEGQFCRIVEKLSDNYYLLENFKGEQFKASDLSNLD